MNMLNDLKKRDTEKKIIFYQPLELSGALNNQSGTVIRPKELKKAFIASGYMIFDINGSIKDRVNLANNLIKNNSIEYMYVESANIPMCISNKKHWKVSFFADLRLFYRASKKMKIGIFYRDIHWKYKDYLKLIGIRKGIILKLLFYFEFFFIKKIFDYIFIPSSDFKKLLPNISGKAKYIPLPPAVNIKCKDRFLPTLNSIDILYSGIVSISFLI